MRLRLILTGLLLAALVGGPALAQSSAGAIKLRGKFTTPTLTATPSPDASLAASGDLRGPLDASTTASTTPQPASSPPSLATDDDGTPLPAPAANISALPAPGQSFAGGLPAGVTGGFAASALPTLPTMRPVGDPAPICRAECSKARAFCPQTDDAGCETQWAQCIAACSGAAVQ